jgi:hypothetical protein|tara:strand:+ start:152 stop:325 length:174 start_codon:yes stop_codon:yes gene_type:complete
MMKGQTADDRLDERLSELHGAERTKTQSFASRRHESKRAKGHGSPDWLKYFSKVKIG